MDKFIYHGGTDKSRKEQIEKDFPLDQMTLYKLSPIRASIGVKEVRELISSIASTSIRPKLVYIESADLLTNAAENALLKTLEEPPSDTKLVLSCDNLLSLLPTIRSRCQSVRVQTQKGLELEENLSIFKECMQASPGVRINLADSLSPDRETNLLYLNRVLTSLRPKLSSTTGSSLQIILLIASACTQAYEELKANCNVRLVLYNLFLALPKTRG